jgi:hypothetical protein
MKYHVISLMLIVVLGIFLAGCTQSSAPVQVTPVVVDTTLPTPAPAPPAPTAAATNAPRQVVTIIHQVSQVKDIRDSDLLFTLQVPVEWSITTYRVKTADPEVMLYKTDLLADNVFSLYTYTVSRSQDQAYRDQFRKWSPAPVETTVTMNNIVYDRFESTSGSRTTVAYVARKSSANERGYASVLTFTADTGNRFEKDDFERIVSSFRYFSAGDAGTMPAEEIPHGNPPFESSGSMNSAKGGSDAGSSEGSPGGCSRCGVS